SDIVVELTRYRTPEIMNDAEHQIALRYGIDNHAHGAHVIHPLTRQVLTLHLAVDAIDMLGPPRNRRVGYVVLYQLVTQRVDDLRQIRFAVGPTFIEARHNRAIGLRVEIAEAEILKFPLDLPDAEPIGKRRENIQRFFRNLTLLVFRHKAERTHVMKPV